MTQANKDRMDMMTDRQTRSKLTVVAERVQLMGSKQDAPQAPPAAPQGQTTAPANNEPPF